MEPVLLVALMYRCGTDAWHRQAFPDAPTIRDHTPHRLTHARAATARLLRGVAARIQPELG